LTRKAGRSKGAICFDREGKKKSVKTESRSPGKRRTVCDRELYLYEKE